MIYRQLWVLSRLKMSKRANRRELAIISFTDVFYVILITSCWWSVKKKNTIQQNLSNLCNRFCVFKRTYLSSMASDIYNLFTNFKEGNQSDTSRMDCISARVWWVRWKKRVTRSSQKQQQQFELMLSQVFLQWVFLSKNLALLLRLGLSGKHWWRRKKDDTGSDFDTKMCSTVILPVLKYDCGYKKDDTEDIFFFRWRGQLLWTSFLQHILASTRLLNWNPPL